MNENTTPRRRSSLHLKILATGGIGILVALALTVLSWFTNNTLLGLNEEADTLASARLDVAEISRFNSDVTGWQTAYAWDASTLGPQEAVSDSAGNRQGYLDSAAALREHLDTMDTSAFTDAEKSMFDTIVTTWDEFFVGDDEVVALYESGTEANKVQADTFIVTDLYNIYFEVITMTEELDASLDARATALQQDISAAATSMQITSGIVLAIGIVLVYVVSHIIGRNVKHAATEVKRALASFASGNLTDTADVQSRDELGDMANSLREAQESISHTLRSVLDSATRVADSASHVTQGTATVAATVEGTSAQAGIVAAAADEVNQSIHVVASGTEEMGASIREISQNATDAASVAEQATTMVATTNESVTRLGVSSQEIGAVVKVINSIAEQTNLLALNATIEAARAGEAGRGFAVVAGEVKELAQETARATEDIAQRVDAIQTDTTQAVNAMGKISDIIQDINSYQLTIASAVEEQTATTNEMARSVSEAANGSSQIAGNINSVAQESQASTAVITQMRESAQSLATESDDLRTSLSIFSLR